MTADVAVATFTVILGVPVNPVALPVRVPTNEVAVTTPVTFNPPELMVTFVPTTAELAVIALTVILGVPVNPVALPVILPVKLPTNVVAVTIPVTFNPPAAIVTLVPIVAIPEILAFPKTSSSAEGFDLPMPNLASLVNLNFSLNPLPSSPPVPFK